MQVGKTPREWGEIPAASRRYLEQASMHYLEEHDGAVGL